jgi:hypothetical protein
LFGLAIMLGVAWLAYQGRWVFQCVWVREWWILVHLRIFCFLIIFYGQTWSSLYLCPCVDRLSEQRRLEDSERERRDAIEKHEREIEERRRAVLGLVVDNGVTTVRTHAANNWTSLRTVDLLLSERMADLFDFSPHVITNFSATVFYLYP